MNGSEKLPGELKGLSATGLYERVQVVDPDAGEITILTPITVGRLRDTERPVRFFSSIMLMMQGRPQQLAFELEGCATLVDAVAAWPEQAKAAGEKALTQMEDAAVRRRLAVPAGARLGPMN